MNITNFKWFRRLLLSSIYGLGVLGILGSGPIGIPGFDGDPCANNICITPPPPDTTGTYGFNSTVWSVAAALDSSDDVYVGGRFTIYKDSAANMIARLNNDGSLDTGFVTGTGFNGGVNIVAPAKDGSGDVYAGGAFTEYNGTAVVAIGRLNLDGTLDTNFDTGSGMDNVVHVIAAAIDGSGDVFVAGYSTTSYNGTFVGSGLIRLNDDGSIDAGFSTGSGWGGRGRYSAASATDGSGDIYVTRGSGPGVARLNNDGSIDAGFDTGASGFNDLVRAIAVATDGSGDVYVAGYFTDYNGTATNGLARLNNDGSLDSGFVTDAGFVGWGNFITPAIDGSGDIYVDRNITGAIVRLNDDGSIDTGFDIGTIGLNATPNSAALATDGSGDIYVGGGFTTLNLSITARIARFTAEGVFVR